ncbi:hypothetical protein NECAME_05273, partial [Necator americanus]
MERKHPPLRRVTRGIPASISVGENVRAAQGAEFNRRIELNEEDSCYSSCSEESHPSLSRESSETVGSEFGLGRLKIEENNSEPPTFTAPAHLVEFARNLGYSEERLIAVLKRVGCDAGQDRILAELVQMGRGCSEQNEGSTAFITTPSSSLRPIVIDGSNIAM